MGSVSASKQTYTGADGKTYYQGGGGVVPASGSGGGTTVNNPKTPATTTIDNSSPIPPALPRVPNAIKPTSGSEDAGFEQAMKNVTPGALPSESDFFDKVHEQLSPVFKAIAETESAAEAAAYGAGDKEMTDLKSSLGSRGLGGSSDAARFGGQVNMDTASAIASAKKDQATAISSAFQFLTGEAYTEFTDARTNNQNLSKDYVQNMQATALQTIKGLAESGITSADQIQAQNPQAYMKLLEYYNGDPSALNSAIVMNQPNNKIAQSWVEGSKYYQLVTDPITGQPKVQSIDTGINIPVQWTPNKVSTTTLLMQDPNDPANSITYTTNPFTGAITASGSGTGQAIADQYNATNGGGSNSNSTPSGDGSTAIKVAQQLGVATDTPLADAVTSVGIGPFVAAMIQNEGGSPTGVQNNPGNIKFTGQSGQIDSGVKSTDGGTFASYSTPEAGQNAVGDLITAAASGQSSAYGSSPTVGDFIGKYTNTGVPQSGSTASGLPTAEYGLLANVQGFNPKSDPIDSASWNYLKQYLTQGKTPTAAGVGISTRTGSGAVFNQVSQRASDLYYQATGQPLPDLNILNSNKKLLVGNNSILNTLNLQEKTISANSDLLLKNLNGNNINQNAPLINGIIDQIRNSLGDPDVATYLAQNATISNELGSLLALKNATGTTVHDKLESAGIIDKNDSADQVAAKVKVLMQEAENGRRAIGQASEQLYAQIDPAGLQSGNPANQSGYSEFQGLGFTNNYNGTWTAPDGAVWKADASGNPVQVQQ